MIKALATSVFWLRISYSIFIHVGLVQFRRSMHVGFELSGSKENIWVHNVLDLERTLENMCVYFVLHTMKFVVLALHER